MKDRTQWLDSICVLPSPDRRKIWQWAHDAIAELPAAYAIRGRFSVENSPWLKAPFESCQDPKVRRTTVSKAVQSGGTLLAEIVAAWRMVNDPGPSTFTLQSAEMAAIEGKTRIFPLFEAIPQIARLLPRPGPLRTQTEVFFPGGSFFILNSANLSHQQSQSVRWKYNDETWLSQWADVYEDACRRVTAFEQQGISHILDISQGGLDSDDGRPCWATWSFRQGSMEEWGALCRSCEKPMPLHFHQRMIEEPERRAGVVWAEDAKRDDGTYDERRAAETVRFVCPHCGADHEDTEVTRAAWRRTGRYICTREDAQTDWKSYHWEAVAAHSMRLLALEWCQAENVFHRMGDDSSRRKFKQKREARAWKVERQTITLSGGNSDHTTAQYWNGERVEAELHRFMTIDRQQTHFWVEVGAWTQAPEYWQLYFGRVDTIDQVRAIQLRYGVPDSCVAQDRRYQQAMVDADCLRFGWRGMEGVKKKTWTLRNEATGNLENFPHSDVLWSAVGGGSVPYYQFSSNHCKDIVANAASGKGFRWKLPKDVNPLYLEHLRAEEKREIRTGVWEWVEVKQNHNHGFDTSALMVCVAIIAGLVRFTLESDKA
jgi:hypothetical protein